MSVPTTHLAALASQKQPVSVEKIETQTVKDEELLIKVTSAAINPLDWKIKDVEVYHKFAPKWPVVLGVDGAGVVASVGKNVSNFKIGDRVVFQGNPGVSEQSTFQQFAVNPASLVSRLPSNVSDDEAATIPLGLLTPAVALYTTAGANILGPTSDGGNQAGKGQSIVIFGGSSSVGQFAIQLARLSGFERIVTSASPSHREFLQKIGGKNTIVLDRHSAQVKDYLEATAGLPLRTIFDSISNESTQFSAVEILKESWSKQSFKPDYPLKVLLTGRPQDKAKSLGEESSPSIQLWSTFGSGHIPPNRALAESLWASVEKWLQNEELFPSKVQVVKGGLKGLEEALQLHKAGVSGVKIVINPDQTQ